MLVVHLLGPRAALNILLTVSPISQHFMTAYALFSQTLTQLFSMITDSLSSVLKKAHTFSSVLLLLIAAALKLFTNYVSPKNLHFYMSVSCKYVIIRSIQVYSSCSMSAADGFTVLFLDDSLYHSLRRTC